MLGTGIQVTVGTASTGAMLNFGQSSGEQTIFNQLTVNSNSTLVFNLGSPAAENDNLFIIDTNGLTLGTGLRINVTALSGFGAGSYQLIDESGTDLGNPFTLGTRPGGFGYTLRPEYNATFQQYKLFLDVSSVTSAFFWKGGVDNKWSAAAGGNWVDGGGNVINGVPGLVSDVTFSAAGAANQANTVVNVNLGAKTLTISDAAVASITGSSGAILALGNELLINSTVGSVSLGSSVAGQELSLAIASNFQNWTNNGTGTLTVWNQVFSQVTSGTQVVTINGSSPVDVKGNIINGGLGGKIQLVLNSPSTLTLENTGNTYTGGTLISGGTLEFKAGALPVYQAPAPLELPGGRVEFSGNGTLRWLTGNTDDLSNRLMIRDARTATLDVGANNVNFASPILTTNLDGSPTTGILRKAGSGTLKLANTTGGAYSGGTQISAGTLEFVSGALPATTGDITFTGASTLRWTLGNTNDVSPRLKISDGVAATINTNGNDILFNTAILNGTTSSGGSLTKAGAGTLTLNQAISLGSAYTGGTNIAAGTLEFVGNAIPTSTSTSNVTFTGNSTLRYLQSNTQDISARVQINAGVNAVIDTGSNNVSYASVFQTSPGNLIKEGTGRLSLVAVNNSAFTGSATVNDGTLAVIASGSLSGTTSVNISQGGTFELGGSGNRVNDTAPFIMGAGTSGTDAVLNANDQNETLGTLTIAGPSVVDFKAFNAGAQLKFAPSSTSIWSSTLSVFNWTGSLSGGGADQLLFGSDSSGLTTAQLAQISFFSDDGQDFLGNATFVSGGEVVPVPEPTALIAMFSGLGTLLALRRRRSR